MISDERLSKIKTDVDKIKLGSSVVYTHPNYQEVIDFYTGVVTELLHEIKILRAVAEETSCNRGSLARSIPGKYWRCDCKPCKAIKAWRGGFG